MGCKKREVEVEVEVRSGLGNLNKPLNGKPAACNASMVDILWGRK